MQKKMHKFFTFYYLMFTICLTIFFFFVIIDECIYFYMHEGVEEKNMDPLVPLSKFFYLVNNTNRLPLIGVIVLLIIGSAFFSAVETALTCCNRVRLKIKAENGKKSAKLTLKILKKYDQSLISILVGNNIVNITSSSIATLIALSLINNESIATTVSTIVMTVVVFMFGEIIPKNIAKANSDKLAQILSYPLVITYVITYPIMLIFNFVLWLFKKIFRIKDNSTTLTEDEFKDIVVYGEEEGLIDGEESDIIQAAVDFNDITLKSILTKKENIISLNYNSLSRNEILKSINDIKFSRIPVYIDNPDNIVGILNIRKFLKLAINSKKFALKQSISDVIKVKDYTSLNEMVEIFKNKKNHMAIVYNDMNELIGIVTMEDVLEELVGESQKELSIKGGNK